MIELLRYSPPLGSATGNGTGFPYRGGAAEIATSTSLSETFLNLWRYESRRNFSGRPATRSVTEPGTAAALDGSGFGSTIRVSPKTSTWSRRLATLGGSDTIFSAPLTVSSTPRSSRCSAGSTVVLIL